MRDSGLVSPCVATIAIDETEYGIRMKVVDKRARAVVDRFT